MKSDLSLGRYGFALRLFSPDFRAMLPHQPPFCQENGLLAQADASPSIRTPSRGGGFTGYSVTLRGLGPLEGSLDNLPGEPYLFLHIG